MEPDENMTAEANSRDTYFTTTDEQASTINQFTLPASLNVLEKEYLRTTKEEAIKKIENKYKCSIAFPKLLDQDKYSIKVESKGNKDIIEGEISKLRKDISYQSTSFQSQYSKLGRLLLTSKSDDYNQHLQNIQELAKEKQCLFFYYKNKSDVPNFLIEEEKKKLQRSDAKENNETFGSTMYNILGSVFNHITSFFISEPTPRPDLELRLLDNKKGMQIGNITLQYEIGEIVALAAKTDVIICISSPNGYDEGPIAARLAEAGGYSYYFKYGMNYYLSARQIVSVGGSSFNCKEVYYIPYIYSGKSISWLMQKIEECLDKANKAKMTSISIPVLEYQYTGLNNDDYSKLLIDTVIRFARKDKKFNHLKNINIIIYTKDDYENSFQYAMKSTIADSNSSKQPDMNQTNYISPSNAYNPRIKKFDNSLLFSATSYPKANGVKVYVYNSTISSGHSSAIFNVLDFGCQHEASKVLFDEVKTTCMHTFKRIPNSYNRDLRSTIYDVCSGDCLDTFTRWLIVVDGHGKTSVAVPLLTTELQEIDIQFLVKLIEKFAKRESVVLKEINFIIGRSNQAQEIATWMQDFIKNRRNIWEINTICSPICGIKAAFVAPNLKHLKDMKSSLKKLSASITCRESNVDSLSLISKNSLDLLKLDIWNIFNVILIQRSNNQGFLLYGYDDDIFKASEAIHAYIRANLPKR